MILTFEEGIRRSHEHELCEGDMVSFLQKTFEQAPICFVGVSHLHSTTAYFGIYAEAISSFPHFEAFYTNRRDRVLITQTRTSPWRSLELICRSYKDRLSNLNVG